MVILLLKTRLQYYCNYIRYHFDRITKIELALIFLVFLLLILRSPADIGYNFKWMYDEEFPTKWANIFSICLPIFYILSDACAIYTLRRSEEWLIIGSLPFSRKSITNYYLFRHFSKSIILIIIGSLPFLFALGTNIGLRVIRFFAALGILLFLLLIAFYQAYKLRNRTRPIWLRIIRWIFLELFIIGSIILIIPWLQSVFSVSFNFSLFGLLIVWLILPLVLISIQNSFALHDREGRTFHRIKFVSKTSVSSLFKFTHGFYRTIIINDIVYLWRQKRSSFLIPILSCVIALLICFTESDANAVYVALIFIEVLFSLFLIKTVLALFERDAEKFGLIRSLPITAVSLWLLRWLVLAGIIAAPMLVPCLVLLIKHGINSTFFLFLTGSLIAIPALLATIFCNSCFGLFPQVNLSGYIISISIIMMFLFWFFIPFGTLILLAVMIFWIRKSQRHVQYLEI